ncbi:MAG TPA: molybdopterin dinucleotide binding domain-containing protein, partial [Acidimicrobiales bacterium]|nr:molybdopterin dinucleotide binding domain-containing protein [Acidimicrobiales bacterium]
AGSSSLSGNPDDLTRIGIAEGTRVKVTSSKGSLTVPATFDATVPAGTVVLHWNLGDPSPRALIDASAPVTEVRVETTS